MKILVTGSQGFVGRNLVENLKNIRDGKNRTRPDLTITDIFEYDLNTDDAVLEEACGTADFVFHLAGVNRPREQSEFMDGNFGFTSTLLDTLKRYRNACPVMLSSSIQASLAGRFAGSEYGRSKLAGEELLFRYGEQTGAKVLVYRFPNLFGKWCRPNYNSAVATFCNAVANGLTYTVNDRGTQLELLYIDDLIQEMLDALEGREHRCNYPVADSCNGPGTAAADSCSGSGTVAADSCNGPKTVLADCRSGPEAVADPTGRYCYVPITHYATLGEIVDLLQSFAAMPETLIMPEIPEGSFAKKLYSTYLSYLPEAKMAYRFRSNIDERGNFTELIRTLQCGQVSINVAKPGVVRGQHWHNSKWEIFIVVSGHGLIQERKIGIDPETGKRYPVHSFEVTGEEMQAVQILPGYTHNIINLSPTENLVTVMWANEQFDEAHPDTFYEMVGTEV